MSEIDLYDFTDPQIVAMVARNHYPSERRDAVMRLVAVRCIECGEHWPCPAILEAQKHMGVRRA